MTTLTAIWLSLCLTLIIQGSATSLGEILALTSPVADELGAWPALPARLPESCERRVVTNLAAVIAINPASEFGNVGRPA